MRIARWILPITTAAVTALVGTIPASAGWSARVTATGIVTVGQETVSVAPTPISTVMTNDLFQTTYLVSVTNTQTSTTFAGPSNVTLTALPASGPATGLGALLSAMVWPVASAAACTTANNPAPGAVSGVWSDGVTSSVVALAPQATALFCVRGYPTGGTSQSANGSAQNRQNLASTLGSASGTMTFTPAFRADITLDDLAGRATATADPISTSLIYPYSPLSNLSTYYQVKPQNILSPAALCLDLRGGVGVGTGAPIDTFTCHNIGTDTSLGNQAISMLPVSGVSALQLRARTTAANNGYLTASSTSAGASVIVNASNTSNLQQLWIPQLVSSSGGSLLQLVNAATGFCLTAPSPAGSVGMQPCTSSGAVQTYWYPVGLPFP